MARDSIVDDFLDGGKLEQLSKTYSITLEALRERLKETLGQKGCYKACRTNGAKAVFRKSKDPKYRIKYMKNLGRGVSRGINRKMKDPIFRKKWVKKSRAASKKGTKNYYNY